jgi:hypothetical protein
MPVTLPSAYQNATSRPADVTQTMTDLYNVVQQINAGVTVNSPSNGIGYSTGAGGAVTQATSRTTGVTLNTITGTITGNATSLAAATRAVFTVTNSTVALRDTVLISLVSGPTADTSQFFVSAVAAGSFNITIANLNAATADTGAPIINFAVIKAANS